MEECNKLSSLADATDIEIAAENEHLHTERVTLEQPFLPKINAAGSRMESLDYEINESELFQQDWRNTGKVQYTFSKWLLAFLVGLLTGIVATLMNIATENIAGYKLLGVLKYIKQERYLAGFIYMTGVNFVLTLAASFLVVYFAPTAAGPGAPEIKAYLNGVDTPNMFGATVLIVKIIGNISAVSAGLDLGKEGPLIHIGTCIAFLLGQGGPHDYRVRWRWLKYFDNDRDRRDLITIGASSGVCAAFRAPIGGVLFALEEVATWWRSALLWRTFLSTAVVVVVLRGFMDYCKSGNCGLLGDGGLIMFNVSSVVVRYHVVDIIPVVFIGLLGGLLGSLFNHLLHKVLKIYSVISKKGKLPKLLVSLSVSVFTSICLYWLPFLAKCRPCDNFLVDTCPTSGKDGNFKQFNCPTGYYNDLATLLHSTNLDAVKNIFSINTSNEFQLSTLIIFFLMYYILGLVTFGIAIPSGLFLPILLIGSAYGRMVGIAVEPYTAIDQGLYAVLGAASFMAGSMRMTVSICVIFLELTNNLLLLPVTMIVLLISKTLGDCFNPSIYEILMELKGLPFLHANPEPWMRNIIVGELVDCKPSVVSLSGTEKVSRILEVINDTTHNGFPVIEDREKSNLHGLVLRAHLIQALKKKWFLQERRRMEEWEAAENFNSTSLVERGSINLENITLTEDEMEMYVDLHHLTNTTSHTVVETISVAKAMVLFRQLGLRHLLVLPKHQAAAGVSPVAGILTRQDFRAESVLRVFPHLAKKN